MLAMDSRMPDRFWERVDENAETGCWEWRGSRYPNGYGRMSLDGTERLLHRLVYERLLGPIQDGMVIDHLCRVRCCVNPSHLESVSQQVNVYRAFADVTHCPAGHEYTPENTRLKPTRKKADGSGRYIGRDCRECDRLRQAARRAAKRKTP